MVEKKELFHYARTLKLAGFERDERRDLLEDVFSCLGRVTNFSSRLSFCVEAFDKSVRDGCAYDLRKVIEGEYREFYINLSSSGDRLL